MYHIPPMFFSGSLHCEKETFCTHTHKHAHTHIHHSIESVRVWLLYLGFQALPLCIGQPIRSLTLEQGSLSPLSVLSL